MGVNTINASLLARLFLAGAKNLESKKEWINELNVFPVPDGDTGTNMSLTIMAAAAEVSALGAEPTMDALAKSISSGSLRGARGNSGVILSQLFRGFCKVVREEEEITVEQLSLAFQKAVETAYKAVMKPKEGTILTVARGGADKATELLEENPEIDMETFIASVISYADEVLSRTPEMLPVLKEAGVVDSGGQGLMQILKGAYDAYLGKEIDYTIENTGSLKVTVQADAPAAADIKFGYCTEFIIMLDGDFPEETELEFKAFLESIGDSIVCVALDDICKVHVHTNDPGLAIQKALTYGQLSNMKIDNMRLEHQEKLIKEADRNAAAAKEAERREKAKGPRKEVGFISVSIGEGMGSIFRDLGADYLIEGGQTMNPSTEDMLNAIEQVNADTIFIFPNNKNIILAANQAQTLVQDKTIIVVPTKTIPQGITALIAYAPERTPQENEEAMIEAIGMVRTGQLTYAVRDTHIDDKEIHSGDIMGVGDNGILAVGPDLHRTAIETVDLMMDEDAELISVYYGSDTTAEDAQVLAEVLEAKYPDCDVEVNEGGQPIYYYIISVE